MRIKFDDFELDTERRELFLSGALLVLPPKAYDVLTHLVENRDRVVTKSELLDRFWSVDTSEAVLSKAISQIRKLLSATPAGAEAIRTSYGLGYTFALPAVVLSLGAQLLERHWATVLVVLGAQGDAAQTLVNEQGGEILRIEADETAFVFGNGQTMDDAARRAVHCADVLCCGNIGVCSGLTTTRLNENDNNALPQATAAAAALAHRAGAGRVLIDSETRAQLKDEIETVAAGEGYRVTALSPPFTGVPQRPSGRQSRTVGRESEMAFLTSRFAMLKQDGGGQAVLLVGPPGIGKTRLLSEFLGTFDTSASRIERLYCLPALCNTALAPLHTLCRALFPAPPVELMDNAVVEALFAELTGAHGNGTALATLSDHQRDQSLRTLFFRLVKAAAKNRALIIAVEDVHWLDATTRGCLEFLVQRIGETRICLVMTSRPVDGPALADVVLPLAPLGRIESLNLLRDPALSAGFDDAVADILVRRAGGNPFFIEELARASEAGGDPAIDLPQTIHAVIALRISGLDVAARQLLLCAAVIGPPAPRLLIARLAERDVLSIEDGLAELVRRDFLRVEKSGLVFRHMLIQDTAYDMLAKVEKRRLHGIAADSLIEAGGAASERLAFHLQCAGRIKRATTSWCDATRGALHRSALNEAVAFARNGIDLLASQDDGDSALEMDLQLSLASALTALNGFGAPEVGVAYARAEVLLMGSPPGRAHIRVLVGLWIHTWVRGRLSEALGHATSIMQIAKHAGDPSLTLQAFAGLGQVQFHLGNMQLAHQNLTAGLAAIKGVPPTTAPSQNAATSCAAYLGWTQAMLGQELQARDSLTQSQEFVALRENPYAEAIYHALATGPLLLIGDVDVCLEHAQRAETLSREHGFPMWLGTGLVLRGWCLAQSGKFDAAFDALDEGLIVFEASYAGIQVANFHGLRAECLLAAGRHEEGLAAAKHALELAEEVEDMWFVPRILATSARLASALRQDDLAAAYLGRAQDLTRQFGIASTAVTLA